ncbi:MAG TPA: response regulator [Candidatus Limnocylindria bacterium]|nr:response regulator [Candidatus Limnocylindria bacterium]
MNPRQDGARPRVLVIDDDDALCETVRQVLGDAGYAVATVPHGAAALELIRQHQPAVILLDLRMPIMDGWSFVDQYRRLAHPAAKIVLLSGARDLATIARTLEVDGHVAKPFAMDDLTREVERALGGA